MDWELSLYMGLLGNVRVQGRESWWGFAGFALRNDVELFVPSYFFC